jgi:hypothetical protein
MNAGNLGTPSEGNVQHYLQTVIHINDSSTEHNCDYASTD